MSRRRVTTLTACLAIGVGLLSAIPNGAEAAARSTGASTTGRVWASVSTGTSYTCGVRRDHTLWCWGRNDRGELGLGDDPGPFVAPTQVGASSDWTSVSAGQWHTCAIRSDHSLWCWGDNEVGQLGLGDTADRNQPTQVGSDLDWADVESGPLSTCGIRTDHSLWCWGWNLHGELGLGDRSDRDTPTRVGDESDWMSVAADTHTCGVRADGTLWCWGENNHGQLGLGDRSMRMVPTQVGSDTDWAGAEAGPIGSYDTCGIRTDTSLWCWGLNHNGQLGLGTYDHRYWTPMRVRHRNWATPTAGGGSTCAIHADSTLWCWGLNREGDLGLPGVDRVNVPTRVTGRNWASVSAHYVHTCGVRRNHTLWCWGENLHGELGLGYSSDSVSTPTRV